MSDKYNVKFAEIMANPANAENQEVIIGLNAEWASLQSEINAVREASVIISNTVLAYETLFPKGTPISRIADNHYKQICEK